MTNPIETITLTVDAPEAGWSAIRFGDEAVIPLSYIQNIPEDIIEAAKAWMDGEDVTLSIDGEGEIWELHMPAGDGFVTITDADEDLRPTNIPAKVLLLQLLDGMLAKTRGWAIWQSMYDDEPVDDGTSLDAWNRYIAKKAEELDRTLQTVRDELKEA